MQYSQEHLKTTVYAEFGGQTECIMGNWKIKNVPDHPSFESVFFFSFLFFSLFFEGEGELFINLFVSGRVFVRVFMLLNLPI